MVIVYWFAEPQAIDCCTPVPEILKANCMVSALSIIASS